LVLDMGWERTRTVWGAEIDRGRRRLVDWRRRNRWGDVHCTRWRTGWELHFREGDFFGVSY